MGRMCVVVLRLLLTCRTVRCRFLGVACCLLDGAGAIVVPAGSSQGVCGVRGFW